MKIISIVGARPQFIKLAPLSKLLRKFHKEIIVHTGQHFDKEMSQLFFNELNIDKPEYNLNINSSTHAEQTGRMLIEIEKVLIKEKPDLVIVYGDTNSTLAGALAAVKLQIPIIHIEAGLRSFNKNMPEEINRVITDHISDYRFAPTKSALNNLKNENLAERSFLTGDIMVDSLKMTIEKSLKFDTFSKFGLKKNNYYLLTLHRPYNVDSPFTLRKIFKELNKLSKKIVFPVHPRTKKMIERNNIKIPKNIIVINPQGYFNFINLELNADKIITDSGGIQKEAYMMKKPCITLRTETEWVETVESGWNLLINPNADEEYYMKIEKFNPPTKYKKLFGNDVANKMLEIISSIVF